MIASSLVEIHDLPEEVLYEIFSKLTPEDVVKYAINVCKRWNTLIKERKIFWDSLQLVIHCDYFINCSHLDKKSIYYSCNSCKELYSNEILIGEKDLENISSLQCIKLVGGFKAQSNPALLTIRILDIISKFCRKIEKFEITRCFGATSKAFVQFLRERYSDIRELRFGVNATYVIPYDEISRFNNITTLVSHDYTFKKSDLTILSEGCESLSCLWILYSRSPKVDDVLYFLDKKKKVLKELGLGMKIQNCILEKLKECHNLEVFFATDARCITDSCIKSFNLPKLKYFSLHGAMFQQETVLSISKTESSQVSTQLIILDLTGYRFYPLTFTSINGSEAHMNIYRESKLLVTFRNDVNTAISYPWYTKSSFHWMYRNETIFKEFEYWKKNHN